MVRLARLAAACCALGGCALVSGLSDVRVCDTCADAAADAPAVDAGCPCAVPDGWQLVGVTTTTGAACPSGFDARDLVTADPAAAVCDCGCAVATLPSCTTGNVTGSMGNVNGNCTMAFGSVPGGQCTHDAFSLDAFVSIAPLPPTGGACGPPVAAVKAQPARDPVRTCAPRPGQCGALCAGVAGFKTCVAKLGAAACPAGYAVATSAGTDFAAACSCPACSLSPSCTMAKMHFYADESCSVEVLAVPAVAICTATGQWGVQISAVEYTATSAASCAAGGAGAASATYTNATTICCAK